MAIRAARPAAGATCRAIAAKARILTKGVRPGFKLPKEEDDNYTSDPTVTGEQGLNELRASIQRLKTEPQRHTSSGARPQ